MESNPLKFGEGPVRIERNFDSQQYHSGRYWRSYYKWICLRCGGFLNGRSMPIHDRAACDDSVKAAKSLPHLLVHALGKIAEHQMVKAFNSALRDA